ncbi:hypothetical protein WAI453_008472 [Rhynchosporium graminicola]|uniref:Uncharacterized protein n=1 Tax=Rhynchosporium graminicola TaxID=2792576 RepID=A0A1E1KLQ5_9HELO|nr:uncharacterized protein RCO7_00360 [Rhynchosporium commune]
MGRTSKFSFPIPGRKHKEAAPATVESGSGNNFSKAQRILGTTSNLNIERSPVREDAYQQWRHPGSRSSGMSISISDSTYSAESIHESQSELWAYESNALPKGMSKSDKASSTLLGRRYVDDMGTSASERSARLGNKDSSSTLKSFYDRQKAPLSISQQTSASSARDQALRKGYSPVIQKSLVLQVEPALDRFDSLYASTYVHHSPEKKKKPGRLDLSKLFPKPRRHGDKSDSDCLTPSPSSSSTNVSHAGSSMLGSARRKLKKSLSKDSMRSQKLGIRSDMAYEQSQTNGTLLQLYDHYENMPARSPRMDQIPESRVPDSIHIPRNNTGASGTPVSDPADHSTEPSGRSSEKESLSWQNVRSSLVAANPTSSGLNPSSLTPPNSNRESTSAASISSRNTKASKTTASSSFTHSDLQERSVLSLSDDSEDDSETDPRLSCRLSSRSKGNNESIDVPLPENSKKQSDRLTSRKYGQRSIPRNQQAPYLTVPKSVAASSRPSDPWNPPTQLTTPHFSRQHHHSQFLSHRAKDTTDMSESVGSSISSQQMTPPSIASIQSLQIPFTPPLSPSSMRFRQTSEPSSRFMAVTQQEEALLEALRQKRARMREEIIEEHETTMKTPPRESASEHLGVSSVGRRSSASTLRSAKEDRKQTVLLYLDTSSTTTHAIDTAESSPDLDGFLGLGSDDDSSTPRTSWISSHSGKLKPDRLVTPLQRHDTVSSLTPPSAARLSAVGAARGFRSARSSGGSSKKRNTGVRFVDDSTAVAQSDETLVHEEPMLWNV